MKGTNGRRTGGASGDRCPIGHCAATALVIAGALLLVAGTVLAYSEWQSEANVPEAFGPDAAAEVPLADGPTEGEAVPEPAGKGAVILPPLELVPRPTASPGDYRLAFPLLRRDGADAEAEDEQGRRTLAADIPRVPSWVDSTFSRPRAKVGSQDGGAGAYPPPFQSNATPMLEPKVTPLPTATPIPTETPVPTETPTPSPTPYPAADAPPTRIQIPAVNLDAPVVPVGARDVEYGDRIVRVWNVADYAAGWHETSVYPGQQGNIVISGHNNIRGEVFRDIVNLEAGAEITLTAEDRPYTYVVESKMVIPEKGRPFEERLENNRWIGYFEDERLTLVTCWPYTSNTHRVIVIARPRR